MSHTITYRLNALLTHAVTVLAVMCALAAITSASPSQTISLPPYAIPCRPSARRSPPPIPAFPAPPFPRRVSRLETHLGRQGYHARALHAHRRQRRGLPRLLLGRGPPLVLQLNTKQIFLSIVAEYESPFASRSEVSVWDRIVERKESALLRISPSCATSTRWWTAARTFEAER